MPTPYDQFHPDLWAVRQILFDWLRANLGIKELPSKHSERTLSPLVRYEKDSDIEHLVFHINEVFWQLVTEHILLPGLGAENPNLPFFRLTKYGADVLQDESGHPHDPAGYIRRLKEVIPNIDPTVLAYTSESLQSLLHGCPVASTLLLGVAAERVFLLVYKDMENSLPYDQESKRFKKAGNRGPMKEKLNLVQRRVEALYKNSPKLKGMPENVSLTVTGIYDLLRNIRNDLGHPQETPPNVSRNQAYDYLIVFRGFYKTAEDFREFLQTNQISKP